MSGRIPRARAADRWNPETPGKLSRDLGHAQATIAPGPLPYPTAPGPPGAVAAAAFTSPAPYSCESEGPPNGRAVARSRATICAGDGWRPNTPEAMIKAAVAATWGEAIEVPS
jgi:hypothetical protein